MVLIKIQGFPEYENWVGILGQMVSSTSAQGEVYECYISPTPMKDDSYVSVMLPKSCIKICEKI